MKIKRTYSYFLYALSLMLLASFFLVNALSSSPVHPVYKILILLSSCLSSYAASALLSKTVSKKKAKRLKRLTLLYFFALYLLLVFTLTWADEFFGRAKNDSLFIWDLNEKAREAYLKTGLQKDLFATIKRMFSGYAENKVTKEFLIMNILGNIMLLMPLGYFLPKLFKKQKNVLVYLFTVLFTAVLIEGVQLILMIGVCDIDDLLLNISGALMTFFLFKMPILKKLV